MNNRKEPISPPSLEGSSNLVLLETPMNSAPNSDDEWGDHDMEDEDNSDDFLNQDDSETFLDSSSLFIQKHKAAMRKLPTASVKTQFIRRFIDKLQSIRVPERVVAYLPVSPDGHSLEDGVGTNLGGIHLIKGIDRVVYGTSPASEVVKICGIKPLRYFWYILSGFFCDLIQFFIDYCLHTSLRIDDPTKCWALGFSLSIIVRHSSHRYLVFGMYVGGYWNSLLRMYGGYSVVIVLSTLSNLFMIKVLALSHYTAWTATLLWTGIVSYFILKRIWSFGGNSNSISASGNGGKVVSSGLRLEALKNRAKRQSV